MSSGLIIEDDFRWSSCPNYRRRQQIQKNVKWFISCVAVFRYIWLNALICSDPTVEEEQVTRTFRRLLRHRSQPQLWCQLGQWVSHQHRLMLSSTQWNFLVWSVGRKGVSTDSDSGFLSPYLAVGVSSDCSSNIYCGRGPISEPEAQAVTYFVGSRKEDFLCFLTIHSYGQLLLVPYGHPNFTAPNYEELVFTVRHSHACSVHAIHCSYAGPSAVGVFAALCAHFYKSRCFPTHSFSFTPCRLKIKTNKYR